MERLTIKSEHLNNHYDCKLGFDAYSSQRVLDKLGKYEDSGLSPEEVSSKLAKKQVCAHWYINPDGYYPQCSRCQEEPPGREMTKFCPNCGALMDDKPKGI